MEGDGDRGACGERESDGLGAEVDAKGMEEGLEEEVGEGGVEVSAGGGGQRRVLAEEEEDGADVEPEECDGEGGEEEEEDGAMERQAEEAVALRAEGLPAYGLHAHGEPREDGIAGDVGEPDGEGASGERQVAEATKKQHGDHGPGIEEQAGEDHRQGQAQNGLGFYKSQRYGIRGLRL